MKKENIIIGAISVIGLLTLFNTYKIITSDEGRTITALDPKVSNPSQLTDNEGANFPSTLPQQNSGAQPQPITQGMPDIPKTGINFATSKKDFGKVLSTSSNSHTFVFTNTGTEPLVISNAKGSCGCTVPEWPKEPILPGDKGEIKVTVTANTNPANSILTITGDIQADPNAPKPQPISPLDAAAM